jgi:MFS transporter, FSR family, fosmidomycin resistance protein
MDRQTQRKAAIVLLYSTAHFSVDAVCAATAYAIWTRHSLPPEMFAALLMLYHALAFGLQGVCGLVIDATCRPRLAAAVGCLIAAVSLLLTSSPLAAIITAGVGNAVFHVGGGVVCLQISPHRATIPGLFVSTGSAGLFAGVWIGMLGADPSLFLFPIACCLGLLMAVIPVRNFTGDSVAKPFNSKTVASRSLVPCGEWILLLVLLTIVARALLGFLAAPPGEPQSMLRFLLMMAILCGKALGGIVADRWGWRRVGVISLAAAALPLACAVAYPAAAIPGLFLLNMTMPITLLAVAEAMPGRPGFAFGLTCLSLLFGVLPSMLGVSIQQPVVIFAIVLASAFMLYRGLRLLPPNECCQSVSET